MSGVSESIARVIAQADTCSLKRLAWAYGCAKKGSDMERQLEALLRQRCVSEASESDLADALPWK